MDKKKKEEHRNLLLTSYTAAEIRKQLEDDAEDPMLWYKLGNAVSDEEGAEAGIEIYSQGLLYNPFDAWLHFGRGRKNIGLLRFERCIADVNLAIRFHPEVWNFWYYRAVANNLAGNSQAAVDDFMHCFKLSTPEEQYPLVDWMFLSYLDMGDKQKAKEVLELIDHNVMPPTMDYAYRRRVMLYKGVITPEEFIDLEHIKANTLDKPGRVELEVQTLTFGLFAYYDYIGDTEKANEVLLRITTFPPSAAFGCLKGNAIARKRGLIA